MSLKTSLVIDLAGNLQSRSRQYGQSLTSMGKAGQAAMRGLQASSVAMGRGLDSLGNRYTAALTGAGTAVAVKNVMNLQERMTRLGITADASDQTIAGLKKNIEDTANAPDIRLDPAQILSAVESIMEKTGDLKFAEENIRNIGLAIQASGADGAAIGDIFAEFQKQGMSSKDALAAVDTLVEQGKAGAFTLKDLASLGPRVVTAYTALGRSGTGAMREMGAVLQLIRMGTGSSEQAATAWEAMLRTFSDKKKLQFLQKQGVNVLDKKGNIRAINEVMAEILKAAGNKATNLSDVFDAEAIRAFNAMLAEIKKTGASETLEKLLQVQGDGSTVHADSARAAQTANAALQSLKNTWDGFADSQLAEPIQQAADALNRIGPEKMMEALNTAKNVALALGGVVLASKALGVAANVRSVFGSGGKKNGAAGAGGAGGIPGLGGIKLPLPVYVVNKQMSLTRDAMMGKGGDLDMGDLETGKAGNKGKARGGQSPGGTDVDGNTARGANARRAGLGGRAARLAGRAGGVASAGLAVYEAGRVVMDDEATLADKAEGVASAGGQAVGGWGGAALGGKLGAAIGTAIAPGIGTAIGAALGAAGGGIAGALGAEWLVNSISDFFKGDKPDPQAQQAQTALANKIDGALFDSTIRIQVDGAATATVTSNNGMGNLDVYSGTSFAAGLSD